MMAMTKKSLVDRATETMNGLGLRNLEQRPMAQHGCSTRTGIPSLDFALGGGLPSGVTELYGEPSVGKTALLGHIFAQAQSDGFNTLLIQSEAFDRLYLESLGVVPEELGYIAGVSDIALRIALDELRTNNNLVVGIDSLTFIRPYFDDPGVWAETMLILLEEAKEYLHGRSSIVVLNQARTKKSVHPLQKFSMGIESAARRITRLFDARIELSRDQVTSDTYTMVAHILANPFRPPARFVELRSTKGEGVDVWTDIVAMGVKAGVLDHSASWVGFEGNVLAQGIKATGQLIRNLPLGEEVKRRVYEALA